MVDTQQLELPVPPEPPPNRRRRLFIALAALAVVAALVAVLVTVVGGGGSSPPPVEASAAPDAPPPGFEDPLRPQGQSTLDPTDSSGSTEAAVRHNWPLIASDEFDGTRLNQSHWNTYTGRTTDDVGRHDPDNISVDDGTMKITSHGRSSGGMRWEPGQRYGRWEVRARAQRGNGYSAVILLWPDAEDWPEGGEINFMEIPGGERTETFFVLHYGENNRQVGTSVPGDFTQWHNYAVEWAPDRVVGFIDGQEIFRSTDPQTIPPRRMHLAIQQDIGPFGKNWVPPIDDTTPAQVQMEVDWVRIYGVQ